MGYNASMGIGNSWKKNITFETIKGVFIGALSGGAGLTLTNLLTSAADMNENQDFKKTLGSKTKKGLPPAAIFGGIAGAVYYRKKAKDFNDMLDEKWTVRVEEKRNLSNKSRTL